MLSRKRYIILEKRFASKKTSRLLMRRTLKLDGLKRTLDLVVSNRFELTVERVGAVSTTTHGAVEDVEVG